ncbi:MAG: 4'-phosphopantetheinyl transferase superfamily protein [Actinobacteria bacterium]|nr:4'-phosphopantetheinyl transferase superfamily protein [Actinomycetota bacterium]
MIERLLPNWVSAVEASEDPPDAALFPAERAVIARAVATRRAEFTTVRMCARAALGRLGVPAGPIVPGPRGAPTWPAGVVGSMTHCAGYRAAAVARCRDAVTVGIDAEPHAPLPSGVLGAIARPEELAWLAGTGAGWPATHWDRLLFSAKEAVYKAWYPLTGRWLDFQEAVVIPDPAAGTFAARLLVPGPDVANRVLSGFAGRFLVAEGLIVTAITVGRQQFGPADAVH